MIRVALTNFVMPCLEISLWAFNKTQSKETHIVHVVHVDIVLSHHQTKKLPEFYFKDHHDIQAMT